MQEVTYTFTSDKIPITVRIHDDEQGFVPVYEISITVISPTTDLVLQKIRDELVSKISLGAIDITDPRKHELIEQRFGEEILRLVKRYFPLSDEATIALLYSYFIRKNLGMGDLEILMDDENLEEIVVNNAKEPAWVYHKRYGWLKTTVRVQNEEQIQHYARIIARKSDKQITILSPLLDASLETGDRINATFFPVSIQGNTITIRKFASKPWTITDFLNNNVLSTAAAALMWQGIQYELSALVAGGTASGKTSMLNVLASFFPPNQRIITIEDTRELQLPSFLHWIPMLTRQPNPEGRGEISMLDLLINSLRMRPDRILVGEIRRHKEAEVLFEAIHTGHSVYATVHANDVREVFTRLTNPPIEIPQSMLQAISMIVIQYRNRRTGLRRTFQVAEIMPDGNPRVLMQLDIARDKMDKLVDSITLKSTLSLLTGMTDAEIIKDLAEKEKVLSWLMAKNINTVDEVGKVMAEYYTRKDKLMQAVEKRKDMEEIRPSGPSPPSRAPILSPAGKIAGQDVLDRPDKPDKAGDKVGDKVGRPGKAMLAIPKQNLPKSSDLKDFEQRLRLLKGSVKQGKRK